VARYALFIDGGYFRKVLREFQEPRISYLKLSQAVAGREERLRTYYYDCPPFVGRRPSPDDKERQRNFDSFKRALEFLPRFQVRLGRLARYDTAEGVKFIQKKVDILLAVDLVKLSLEHQIQRAVLIAGDSDFVPAIQIARDAGTVVELYYCSHPRPHRELMEAVDERKCIDQAFIDRILVEPSPDE